MTILKTQTQGFNPYFINGKQINTIHLYKNGKVVSKFKWFGNNNTNPKIKLDFEIVNKRKHDFKIKGGFAIKEIKYNEKVLNIYLNLDNFKHSEVEEIKRNTAQSISKYSKISVDFTLTSINRSYDNEAEKVNYINDDEFKIYTKEIQTFVSAEPSKHKKSLDNFINTHNLKFIDSYQVMDVLRAAKCTNILDNYSK